MADVAATETGREADRLPRELEQALERHRVELTAHCYRMLGSTFEADDALQEVRVRAWRGFERFEGRSAVKSWLYRIATNVCLDMLSGRQRRALPIDLGPAQATPAVLGTAQPEATWIQPAPDGRVLPTGGDPADLAVERDTIRLAFIAALQHLPPRQRAVLILREVLRWRASEVAELLDTTVVSVNSTLQRARATLAASAIDLDAPSEAVGEADEALLARYVDAFERYDLDSLIALLAEDATMSMPPFALWFQGRADIRWWLEGPGSECAGSRLVPTAANGTAAFGQYRPSGPGGRHEPWALSVIETTGGQITGMTAFLDTASLFPLFGLPHRLD
jgi:RNA polymerase sigma-70 factor, ECF subfamily